MSSMSSIESSTPPPNEFDSYDLLQFHLFNNNNNADESSPVVPFMVGTDGNPLPTQTLGSLSSLEDTTGSNTDISQSVFPTNEDNSDISGGTDNEAMEPPPRQQPSASVAGRTSSVEKEEEAANVFVRLTTSSTNTTAVAATNNIDPWFSSVFATGTTAAGGLDGGGTAAAVAANNTSLDTTWTSSSGTPIADHVIDSHRNHNNTAAITGATCTGTTTTTTSANIDPTIFNSIAWKPSLQPMHVDVEYASNTIFPDESQTGRLLLQSSTGVQQQSTTTTTTTTTTMTMNGDPSNNANSTTTKSTSAATTTTTSNGGSSTTRKRTTTTKQDYVDMFLNQLPPTMDVTAPPTIMTSTATTAAQTMPSSRIMPLPTTTPNTNSSLTTLIVPVISDNNNGSSRGLPVVAQQRREQQPVKVQGRRRNAVQSPKLQSPVPTNAKAPPIRNDSTSSTTPNNTTIIPDDQVTNRDVLSARGGRSNHHAGNIRYLREKEDLQERYFAAKKKADKTAIAQELIDTIQKDGGRFLKIYKKGTTKVDLLWIEMDNLATLTKVSQALRELNTPEIRAAKRAKYR